MLSVKGAPCGLAADYRADTGHRFVQGVCHRQVALAGRRHDGRRADGQKIRPGRLGGRGVGQAGQELTDIAVLEIHPLQSIDDLAVLHQHQIGVTAHQLGAEDVAHQVAHLVGTLELEVDDPVARLHPDVQQTPPVRCFRISIQKEGGVSGFSKLSSVRQTRAEPLRADSSRLYVSVRVRRVMTSSSRVGSNSFAILASASVVFSSAAVSASVAASNAICITSFYK